MTRARVEIYTDPFCGFCHMAKQLLAAKGVAYEEIDLLKEPARRSEMLDRSSGRRTVPQIFIDGNGIGGCDELRALDASGRLDAMLEAGLPGTAGSGAAGTEPGA